MTPVSAPFEPRFRPTLRARSITPSRPKASRSAARLFASTTYHSAHLCCDNARAFARLRRLVRSRLRAAWRRVVVGDRSALVMSTAARWSISTRCRFPARRPVPFVCGDRFAPTSLRLLRLRRDGMHVYMYAAATAASAVQPAVVSRARHTGAASTVAASHRLPTIVAMS